MHNTACKVNHSIFNKEKSQPSNEVQKPNNTKKSLFITEELLFLSENKECIMPNPFFSFKKFTVYHDRCAMKVGTDGVLLGAWTNISSSQHILDIGTGTGLIALMLAQRNPQAFITAIDIDEGAVEQARDNIQASPWKDRIEATLQDIRSVSSTVTYDTIVSNPPYFIDSLKCPNQQRNIARHTDMLNADSLFEKVAKLLTKDGRFSMIFPAEQTGKINQIAESKGLYPTRHTAVITRPGVPPKRSLMEFQKTKKAYISNELTIELERHIYSEDYKSLTKDFFLKM